MAIDTDPEHSEREVVTLMERKPRSLWRDAWRRMRRNTMAIIGLVFICLLLVIAVAAPLLTSLDPMKSDVKTAGQYRKAAWETDPNPLRTGSWDYPLGTDSVGRDVFTRLIYGVRVALLVGMVPMVMTVTLGTLFGLIAGYAGGKTDNLMMRFADVIYAFPELLFYIIMGAALRETEVGKIWNGFLVLFISLSLIGWVGVSRLVRGQVLSLKEKEFVEAARAIGVPPWRIMFRHILPNSIAPIIVAAAYIIPSAIIAEATLSYLGIGTRSDVTPGALFPTSWGSQILEGKGAMSSQPWMLIAPSLTIALMSLAFTAMGDGLQDALDPRSEQR